MPIASRAEWFTGGWVKTASADALRSQAESRHGREVATGTGCLDGHHGLRKFDPRDARFRWDGRPGRRELIDGRLAERWLIDGRLGRGWRRERRDRERRDRERRNERRSGFGRRNSWRKRQWR